MLVDCCGQNRTYEKFFGLTATRLCMLKREYMELFELIFVEQYETIHRLETNKLRNVAKVNYELFSAKNLLYLMDLGDSDQFFLSLFLIKLI